MKPAAASGLALILALGTHAGSQAYQGIWSGKAESVASSRPAGMAPATHARLLPLVEGLYKRYATQAIPSSKRPPMQEKTLHRASPNILRRIFVSDLAVAIQADAACADTDGVCSIDFDLMYDSQDPIANDLAINEINFRTVEACFSREGADRICVSYRGRPEGGEMKIADVIYRDGSSLLQLLHLGADKVTTYSDRD
jgi:hypothetical protein